MYGDFTFRIHFSRGPYHVVVKMPRPEKVDLARRKAHQKKAEYQKQLREVIVSHHLAASPYAVSSTEIGLSPA